MVTKRKSNKSDDETVPHNLVSEMRDAAERIRGFLGDEKLAEGNALIAAIKAGCKLVETKNKLEYGQFQRWIDTEFNMHLRTAERYQRLSEVFGNRIDTVSSLGRAKAHLLAQKSTPEVVITRVLERLNEGDILSSKNIREMIARATIDEKRANEERLRRKSEAEVEEVAETAPVDENNDTEQPVTAAPSVDGAANRMSSTSQAEGSTAETAAGPNLAGGVGGSADKNEDGPADLEGAPEVSPPKVEKTPVEGGGLFGPGVLPNSRKPKTADRKATSSGKTTSGKPAPSARVTEEHSAEASDERSKEWFAERHARRADRYRRYRIGKSVRSLARIPIPRLDNLDDVLSQRFRERIRQALPKARAALNELEEVINSSLTANE